MHPPAWLDQIASEFLMHVAEPFYWLFATAALVTYLILRWQRKAHEYAPARTLRWQTLSKGVFWLALALGRTLFGEWLTILYAVVVIYAGTMTVVWLGSLIVSYVWPAVRGRPITAPPIDHLTGEH